MRWVCLFFLMTPFVHGAEPVALRAEQLTVTPSTGPVIHVVVRNKATAPWKGSVAVVAAEGWRLSPASRPIELAIGETQRVPFVVEKAVDVAANAYPLRVTATSRASETVRAQTVVCASAPYFRPKIDGRTGDWANAIPARLVTAGKRTVVSTYWNREAFCLLVEVEENKLISARKKGAFDAVQFALAPRTAVTGVTASDPVRRYEFLLADSGSMWRRDRCYALAAPGMSLGATQEARPLVEAKGAKVVVKRSRGVTRYEASIPFILLPKIRATPGREFCFSVLVHDPDGTGMRDWGVAAGLWFSHRNRLAWSMWPGRQGKVVPFDSKIEWGFCSSKH